jgi:hypothetical protein
MASVSTNNNSDENISQEEIQRKSREKLELELASKEREIATLVIDTQKLQSTLIKIKETSVTQVEYNYIISTYRGVPSRARRVRSGPARDRV